MDRTYGKLNRAFRKGDDPAEQLALAVQIARSQPVEAAKLILTDRLLWNLAEPDLQDFVIEVVGGLLGQAYIVTETRRYDCAGASHRIASIAHHRTLAEFQLIPGGRFQMGATSDQNSPTLAMTVAPMLIGRTPLLQKQWDCVKLRRPHEHEWPGPELPVAGLNYDVIQSWLNEVGDGLRLPGEVEWEYAARAGTCFNFFWGNEIDEAFAWVHCDVYDAPFSPERHVGFENAFGLIDPLGNVSELCAETWDQRVRLEDYFEDDSAYSSDHIARGGDLECFPYEITCAYQFPGEYHRQGVRLARTVFQ